MAGRIVARIPRLSLQIFLLILAAIILPMYGMFTYLRVQFERYMRDEISDQVIQSISKSEQEIHQALKNMAVISSVLASDENLARALMDPEQDYYQKYLAFDSTVAGITTNNLFTLGDVKLTLLDQEGRVYSNWSANYNSYEFLLQQDWVQESIRQQGHITWDMFSPGYIIDPSPGRPQETYISLARSMLSEVITGEYLGTIIVSIEQHQLGEVLSRYAYNSSDRIYVCVDDGEVLIHLDPTEPADATGQIRRVFAEMEGDSGNAITALDGRQYLVSYYTIPSPWTFNSQQLRVLHFTDYQGVVRQAEVFSRRMHLSMVVFLLVLTLLAGIISVRIVRPVRLLDGRMRSYTVQSEIQPLDTQRRDEIGSLNRAFYTMSGYITDLFDRLSQEHEVREQYRFESLRAQLNPHFLFNTLNTIRWMAIIRGADNMVEAIDALAGMLKYTMNRGDELVTLKEELENIRGYVFIQNTRYGDRCRLEIDLEPEVQGLYVVKFILQPIVENAVLHGLGHKEGEGTIRIYGGVEEGTLKLYVEDDGGGIPWDVLEQLNAHESRPSGNVTGIGIANVHERINIVYGDPFGLSVESEPGRYTVVCYTLPLLPDRPQQQGEEETVS